MCLYVLRVQVHWYTFGKWDNIQERGSWMAKRTAALAFSIQSPVTVPSGFVPIISVLSTQEVSNKWKLHPILCLPLLFGWLPCNTPYFPLVQWVHWESAPTVQSHLFACSFPIGNWDMLCFYLFISLFCCLIRNLCSLWFSLLSESVELFTCIYILHLRYTLYIIFILHFDPAAAPLQRPAQEPAWLKERSCTATQVCPSIVSVNGVSMACHASSSTLSTFIKNASMECKQTIDCIVI